MIYLLDTNAISDILNKNEIILVNLKKHEGANIYLCQPVYYEVLRGIIKKNATRQEQILTDRLQKMFLWESVLEQDWIEAAYLWAKTVSSGRQLSDMDLLIAVIAKRLNAILVTSDKDFLGLGLPIENWRVV
jgi:predicted nucleic acid-binding protein